jgi:hypothetical protein
MPQLFPLGFPLNAPFFAVRVPPSNDVDWDADVFDPAARNPTWVTCTNGD